METEEERQKQLAEDGAWPRVALAFLSWGQHAAICSRQGCKLRCHQRHAKDDHYGLPHGNPSNCCIAKLYRQRAACRRYT